MKGNLEIVARNEEPSREETYPRTWLVYCNESTLEVDVEYNNQGKLLVVGRTAA